MLSAWYIPSSSGDIRLEAYGDNPEHSLLTIEDPIPLEIEQAETFLRRCKGWKWVDQDAHILHEGRTEIVIRKPIADCGKHLAKDAMPSRGTLTVVRSVAGKITATVDHTTTPAEVTKAVSDKEADKATTVRRPTTCCPNPIEGPLKRSSEVLRQFCTPQQWHDWVEHGFLRCVGGRSGIVYRLAHRHTELARQQGKICYDETHGGVLKFWDWSIPPAEEVLSAKLILENREGWLRNRSTVMGKFLRGHGPLYHNPLGSQGLDGTWDAGFFAQIGGCAEWIPAIAEALQAGAVTGDQLGSSLQV